MAFGRIGLRWYVLLLLLVMGCSSIPAEEDFADVLERKRKGLEKLTVPALLVSAQKAEVDTALYRARLDRGDPAVREHLVEVIAARQADNEMEAAASFYGLGFGVGPVMSLKEDERDVEWAVDMHWLGRPTGTRLMALGLFGGLQFSQDNPFDSPVGGVMVALRTRESSSASLNLGLGYAKFEVDESGDEDWEPVVIWSISLAALRSLAP